LQDRLVKELRLQGISSIEAANAFAPAFVADCNGRFAKAPHNPFNAHRALLPTEVLDEIFTWQETRKLSQSLSFNYQRQLFLIPDTEEIRVLAGQRLTVVELSDGTVQARHAGKLLPLTRFGKDDAEITQGTIVSNKLLAGALQFIKDKQAEKDMAKLAKLRTKREKRLLGSEERALPKDRYPTSVLLQDPDICTLP